HFAHLFDTPASMFGVIGPSFRWDILNYGRILNNVRVQDARFQELVYFYQNSVLNAAREVEDSLIAFLKNREQARYLADSVKAAQRTFDITVEQWKEGEVDFTPVFLAEFFLTQQQDQLAAVEGEIPLSFIGVYRAVGGGWEIRLGNGIGGPPPGLPIGPPP